MSPEPLVLLPGMGCTPALWSRLDLGCRPVITPVLDQPSVDAQVVRLLDELPPRFALAGLSLGGVLALALVRTAPERVTRLALMSMNPYAPTSLQRAAWREQRRALASGVDARKLQRRLIPVLLSPAVIGDRPDLVELTLGMAEELGAEAYDTQLQLQSTRIDERPGLGRITCPTLVLAARQDRLCSLDRHIEMARLVPDCELVVVEGSAHLSPLEQPTVVGSHLRRGAESSLALGGSTQPQL